MFGTLIAPAIRAAASTAMVKEGVYLAGTILVAGAVLYGGAAVIAGTGYGIYRGGRTLVRKFRIGNVNPNRLAFWRNGSFKSNLPEAARPNGSMKTPKTPPTIDGEAEPSPAS